MKKTVMVERIKTRKRKRYRDRDDAKRKLILLPTLLDFQVSLYSETWEDTIFLHNRDWHNPSNHYLHIFEIALPLLGKPVAVAPKQFYSYRHRITNYIQD